MAMIYCITGAALTGAIAWGWRRDLWADDAKVNRIR
jgi:hypothetical protein